MLYVGPVHIHNCNYMRIPIKYVKYLTSLGIEILISNKSKYNLIYIIIYLL